MFFSEIAASLYPWDLADEGIGRILDNLEKMTRCNSVYLIALMHHEKRPLTDFFYPHNPVRKTYFPEDSRAYWRPEPERYRRISPRTSERDLLAGTDWLRVLVEAARERDMKTGVEISHTVVDSERAAGELSDCMQRDIFGEQMGKFVCPNNPDVREYLCALFCDLAANYDVDYIQTCLIPFQHGRGSYHGAEAVLSSVLGGCWCEHCCSAAAEDGLDLNAVRDALLPLAEVITDPTLAQMHERKLLRASNTTETAVLLEHPELYEWLRFRRDSMAGLFAEIHDAVHSVRADIDVRLNAYLTSRQELSGLDLRAMKPHLDSIRSSDYSEQSGDPARMDHKREWLLSVRRAVGDEMPFFSAIGVRPEATPELIRKGVVISAECGADGITMGHYDGAPFANLRAVGEGLELADVELAEDASSAS
ncbi:MAG: hypothetical protein R6X33_06285 [Candidatus Brocadiia bacterium]